MTSTSALHTLIEEKTANIAVVGLGYVGLPLAMAFAEAGYRVIGIDIDAERVQAINDGESFLRDIQASRVASAVEKGRLLASGSFEQVAEADVVIICVPTPLLNGSPDLSMVVASGEAIGRHLSRDVLVILESTTYPGTTEELLLPELERGGLRHGLDFFLAYSPERIDPGNPQFDVGQIPKVVGGLSEESASLACALYAGIVPSVFRVSGTREAEFAKLLENTFRHVNIGLINELAVYAKEMDVDIWEAIEAAATKPFGFLPFWPGPGWGGHCIPLDPAYLSWRVRRHRAHEVRFVELAHAINAEMPRYVVDRATLLLNEQGKAVNGSDILTIGMAYKGGTEDVRESPAIKVTTELISRGARLRYFDPLVPRVVFQEGTHTSLPQLEKDTLRAADLVIILIPQVGVDWGLIEAEASAVLDCCNAFGPPRGNISRL